MFNPCLTYCTVAPFTPSCSSMMERAQLKQYVVVFAMMLLFVIATRSGCAENKMWYKVLIFNCSRVIYNCDCYLFSFFKRLDAVKSVGITLYLPLFIVLDQNNDRKLSCIETSILQCYFYRFLMLLLHMTAWKLLCYYDIQCLRYV